MQRPRDGPVEGRRGRRAGPGPRGQGPAAPRLRVRSGRPRTWRTSSTSSPRWPGGRPRSRRSSWRSWSGSRSRRADFVRRWPSAICSTPTSRPRRRSATPSSPRSTSRPPGSTRSGQRWRRRSRPTCSRSTRSCGSSSAGSVPPRCASAGARAAGSRSTRPSSAGSGRRRRRRSCGARSAAASSSGSRTPGSVAAWGQPASTARRRGRRWRRGATPARLRTVRWSAMPRRARCSLSGREAIGDATNNVAEYTGLVAGLAAAGEIDPGGAGRGPDGLRARGQADERALRIRHPDMRGPRRRRPSGVRPSPRAATRGCRGAENAAADRAGQRRARRSVGPSRQRCADGRRRRRAAAGGGRGAGRRRGRDLAAGRGRRRRATASSGGRPISGRRRP